MGCQLTRFTGASRNRHRAGRRRDRREAGIQRRPPGNRLVALWRPLGPNRMAYRKTAQSHRRPRSPQTRPVQRFATDSTPTTVIVLPGRSGRPSRCRTIQAPGPTGRAEVGAHGIHGLPSYPGQPFRSYERGKRLRNPFGISRCDGNGRHGCLISKKFQGVEIHRAEIEIAHGGQNHD